MKRYRLLQEASQTATWLIVAGHYTIYSLADHGDNPELISRLVPLFAKYGVHVYLHGHDHVLQHISWQGVEYITSGHATYSSTIDHYL
jgi:tartrate-resistant acid phosphatase type 5